MLSIGKLSAGQARYYLEQGEVRVDAADSIGDGVEEYYAGGAEALSGVTSTSPSRRARPSLIPSRVLSNAVCGLYTATPARANPSSMRPSALSAVNRFVSRNNTG